MTNTGYNWSVALVKYEHIHSYQVKALKVKKKNISAIVQRTFGVLSKDILKNVAQCCCGSPIVYTCTSTCWVNKSH
jgi:hypothetical protein